MSQTAPARSPLEYALTPDDVSRGLSRQLLWLALPILAENVLHMVVGLTDVYLAGHLKTGAADAMAAVGNIAYALWLVTLVAGAIATGSTAIIARAAGARHRSLANSVCGQTVTASLVMGLSLTALFYFGAAPASHLAGLTGGAYGFAVFYMRAIAFSLPFSTVMIAGNACLRGTGDTFTPAVSMILVDVVNVLLSTSLTRGWWGLPELGFRGIAIGTVAAYFAGGLVVMSVLWRGNETLRLRWHRMRPHWVTLKRLFRIGLPSAWENLLTWGAQFSILGVINRLDPTNVMGSAHILTVRIESLSYLAAMAIAGAAATMVGQSLGMKQPDRARRAAYLAYFVGAVMMCSAGVAFILFHRQLAGLMSSDPRIAALSSRCLFVTAFASPGFAAAIIFSGALRGAGDTLWAMLINLGSILGLRLVAVLIVGQVLGYGLPAIWVVLSAELTIRGLLIFARFRHGGWAHVQV